MRRSRKGHLQFFMKEYDKALATYEAGLAHDPESAELKEGVARCYEALDKVPALAACSHQPFSRHVLACTLQVVRASRLQLLAGGAL